MANLDPAQITLLSNFFLVERCYDPTEGIDLEWEQALRRQLLGENWRQLSWEGTDPAALDVEALVADWIANGCSFPTPDTDL